MQENNKSKYRGVRLDKRNKKYYSTIMVEGKANFLGYYEDEKSAAKAYDLYVVRNCLNRTTNFIKKMLQTNE
jgi:hypothetical protein